MKTTAAIVIVASFGFVIGLVLNSRKEPTKQFRFVAAQLPAGDTNAKPIQQSIAIRPTADNEVARAGDTLQIILAGLRPQEMHWNVRVSDDETVMVPIVGPIAVAAKTPDQISRAIVIAMGEQHFYPKVSVSIVHPEE